MRGCGQYEPELKGQEAVCGACDVAARNGLAIRRLFEVPALSGGPPRRVAGERRWRGRLLVALGLVAGLTVAGCDHITFGFRVPIRVEVTSTPGA